MIGIKLQSNQWKYVLFLLIAAILIILFTLIVIPPAAGYESSLHDVYPKYFWILTWIIALAPLGYLCLTHKYPQYFSWKSAYILTIGAIFNRILYSYLPLIRGYVAYTSGDLHVHFAHILHILDTGTIGANHYPYVHIAITEITNILGISKEVAAYHFEAISTLVFLLLLIPICNNILKNKKYTIVVVTLLVIPFAKGEFAMPSYLAYYLLPIYIYFIYRSVYGNGPIRYLLLALIFSILGWFIHPEFVLYSILFVAVIGFSVIIYSIVHWKTLDCLRGKINVQRVVLLIFVLLLGFIYIFSGTAGFRGQIGVFETIFSGHETIEASEFSQLDDLTLSLFELIVLAVLKYGVYLFIPGGVALITLVYIIFTNRQISQGATIFITLFICFGLFSLANMIAGTTIGVHPTRMLKYIYLLSIFMLIIYGIPFILSNPKTNLKKLLIILLVIMVILTFSLSIGKAYGNPELGSQNYGVTQHTKDGMHTFFSIRSDYYLIGGPVGGYQQSYYLSLYGYNSNVSKNNIRNINTLRNDKIVSAEFHMGYDNVEHIGNFYDGGVYQLLSLPIGEFKRILINETYYHNSISIEDYNHLNYDCSALKLLNNGKFWIYFSHPIDI